MTEQDGTARPRKAAGPDRPVYFNAGDIDRVMSVLLALVTEVASIRDRLDAHERIAATGALPAPTLVEAYQPDPQAATERDAWRASYIRRLFRVITEDVEALRAQDTPGQTSGPA